MYNYYEIKRIGAPEGEVVMRLEDSDEKSAEYIFKKYYHSANYKLEKVSSPAKLPTKPYDLLLPDAMEYRGD